MIYFIAYIAIGVFLGSLPLWNKTVDYEVQYEWDYTRFEFFRVVLGLWLPILAIMLIVVIVDKMSGDNNAR